MLSWLQAALPESRVSNLTTDWNSGVLLSALLDYCKPGIFPHWRELSKLSNMSIVFNLKFMTQRSMSKKSRIKFLTK